MMKNLKILIAGGSGMLGSAITRALKETDAIVYGLDSSQINCLDYNNVNQVFQEIAPNYVIFCAGKVGGLYYNRDNQLNQYHQNLVMGLNFFSAAAQIGVFRGINFSSSCAYSPSVKLPYGEDDYFKGELNESNKGYAKAKREVTQFLCDLNKTHRTNFITLVPPNLFGVNDNYDPKSSHFIAAAVAKIVDARDNNDEVVEIRGSGRAQREILSTDKLTEIALKIISNHSNFNDINILNVGTGVSLPVRWIYYRIEELLNLELAHKPTEDSDDVMDKRMDIKLMQSLGLGSGGFDLNEALLKSITDYASRRGK